MSEDIRPEEDRHQDRRRRDDEDDRPRRRRRRDDDDLDRIRDEGDATGGLIPYKNPQALIAYYLGVFSLIPCAGMLLGPAALLLGILGLNYKRSHPTSGGTAHAIVGIVVGSLTSLAHLVVIFLFFVASRR